MYPFSPKLDPQEFLIIQNSPPLAAVPHPTAVTAWFVPTKQSVELTIPLVYYFQVEASTDTFVGCLATAAFSAFVLFLVTS